MSKRERLENLISELIKLGENEEELRYWQTIFEDLDEIHQSQLFLILEKELESLKNK